MKNIIQPLKSLEVFEAALRHLKYKNTHLNISGVSESQVSHLASGLLPTGTKVMIAPTEKKAKEIFEDMKFFEDEKVMFYPSKDLIFFSADVHSNDITRGRMQVLEQLFQGNDITLVMSIEALVDPLISAEILKANSLCFTIGTEMSVTQLAKKLVCLGYERVDLVEGRGQFALRGGLVDIFPMNMEDILRIEFFGDEVDALRLVNHETQRSMEMLDEANVLPAREIIVDEESIQRALKTSEEDYEKHAQKLRKSNALDVLEEVKRTYATLREKISQYGNFNGIESYVFYYYNCVHSILDYLVEPKIVLVEPIHVVERIQGMTHEYNDSMQARFEKGQLLPKQLELGQRFQRLIDEIGTYQTVMMSSLFSTRKVLPWDVHLQFNIKSINVYHQNFDLMIKDIQYYLNLDYKVALMTASKTRALRLHELFEEHQIQSCIVHRDQQELRPGVMNIGFGHLHRGFEYPDAKFAILAETDMAGVKKTKKKRYEKKGSKIQHFSELKVGDYIVHEHHGVGVFRGLETIEVDNVSKDFIKIDYRDNGSLYVATSQLDAIQKYIGAEGKAPKLNKLGTAEWKKTKAKVKGAVEELATELIELYARRQDTKGYIYSNDTRWQQEFEEMFPYDETEDQLHAIADTKKDMESTKIMDRLICGDVGYGKTEVAIRAAFKAVQDSKQVVYLVPTTILAQQHYNNFVQRMKDFPVRIEMMSRFRTPKEQKETLEGLKKGCVDIVIGTHRLVSKDVEFKDLGLLIVDEEQRFGVKHKEKIKHLKEDVDVLTLTATPIPRTLHMSLIGIRDMSVLEEPPEERQPIQTYVLEHNDELIKDAIYREISRDGQVYYVHNRVKDIDEVALKISAMVPEANVAFAHGQMSERELEEIMVDFINGDIDVLVATTIIETGLDIQNVNTIIIQNADHMGLSQLYQLRGRVGRSSRLAYAYLTYKRDKILQEVAEKRLKAIKEFTEFGSGFRIAMRDLEIRGAGNVLGQSQHGHMDAVGYELYCKLLVDAVKQQQGGNYQESFETTIDLTVDAFIPSSYIQNEVQKIEGYKRIAAISSVEDYEDVQDEFIDRYGDIPKSVINLLEIAFIKNCANKWYITAIEEKANEIIFKMKDNAKINPIKIPEILEKDEKRRYFIVQPDPCFILRLNKKEYKKRFEHIKALLQDLELLRLDG